MGISCATRGAIVLLVVAATSAAAADSATAQDMDALEERTRAIIAEYGGEVGVAVEHVESGHGFAINGHERYPLASVYKLPMLIELYRQVEAEELSLDDRIRITTENYHPYGTVMSRFDLGLEPTLRDLAYWMIVQTDNLATDIVLERIGADNVRSNVRRLGLDEITVDRPTKILILDYYGFPGEQYYRLKGDSLARVSADFGRIWMLRDSIAQAGGPLADPVLRYSADPRDRGSPLHVNEILVRLAKGEIVSPEASRAMLDIMFDTRTGLQKIRGLLPPGTPVAHKTGDWPSSNNDAGLVVLPGDKGRVAITVLSNYMTVPFAESARMIARVARAAYDTFARQK